MTVSLALSSTGGRGGLAGLGDVLYGLYGRAILGSISIRWKLFTINRTTGSEQKSGRDSVIFGPCFWWIERSALWST